MGETDSRPSIELPDVAPAAAGTVLRRLGSIGLSKSHGNQQVRGEMSNFETFSRSLVGLRSQPQVTVLRSGMLSLNKAAYAVIGSPEAVDLLYDANERVIGLRPTEIHAETAHLVRRPSSGCSGPFVITAMAFTKFYQLQMPRSIRWDAYLEDAVLCISLAEAGTVVTSNRARDNKPAVVAFRPFGLAASD